MEQCDTSGFEIYCNSVIKDDRRFKNWYQILVIAVAAAAFSLPILSWAIERILIFVDARKKPPLK